MNTVGRRIKMFRCYRDPGIPPRAQNAFMMGNEPGQTRGTATRSDGGVFVKTLVGSTWREYEISLANIENIEYEPEDSTSLPIERIEKRGPGRPPKSDAV